MTEATCPDRDSPKSEAPASAAPEFDAKERDLIRREFVVCFGVARGPRDGILLRRWASGPEKGRVKVSKTVQGMVKRGLLVIEDADQGFPVARFTGAGWRALVAMARNRRFLDPDEFGYVIAQVEAWLNSTEGRAAGGADGPS